jgi:hypothetical protein
MRRPLLLLLLLACNTDSSVNSNTAVAACATAIACNIVDPTTINGLSGCVGQALSVNNPIVAASAHISTQIVNCLAAASTNCVAAKKCIGGGDTPAPCTGVSSSCQGNVLSFCSAAAGSGGTMGVQKFNCGDVGEMCVASGTTVDCGVGTCAGTPGTCVGTKIQLCQNGILQQYDCAAFGSTCVVGALNVPHCRGGGAPCQTQGFNALGNTIRCDGSVLVRCADSQEAHINCAAQGQTCVANVNGETFGCALGSSCNAASFSATCAGNVLSYCDDGVIATYDCAIAGFRGCSPASGGSCTN